MRDGLHCPKHPVGDVFVLLVKARLRHNLAVHPISVLTSIPNIAFVFLSEIQSDRLQGLQHALVAISSYLGPST